MDESPDRTLVNDPRGTCRSFSNTSGVSARRSRRPRRIGRRHDLASTGDPGTRRHAQAPARPSRRVPDEGRARRRRVCRQGAEPAQSGALVLAEGDARRRDPPHPERHRPRGRGRIHDHGFGVGSAAARGQPGQALQAAVQRPAQGRQELPVHQDHARRRLPARRTDAQAADRREPLLRAVRIRDERRRIDEPRPAAVPVPDLHHRHQGRPAGAPAAVPALPHQALSGPMHRGHLEGRLPRRHRAGGAVPRGSSGDAREGPRRGDGGRRRPDGLRARRRRA